MAEYDERLALFDLADRKGYDVTQSTMRDHVRLIDGQGNLVKNKKGGVTFSYAEALPRIYFGKHVISSFNQPIVFIILLVSAPGLEPGTY